MKHGIVLVLSLTLLLTSCQPNPEQDVVVGKNEGVLESAIAETASPEESGGTEAAQTETFRHTGQLAGADPLVQIQVDAEVDPGSGPMPVVRVAPREITMEEARQCAQVLFEGQTIYEYEGRRTRQELEELILRYRQSLADEEWLWEEAQGDPETMQAIRESMEADLAVWESQYADAPDEKDRREAEWTFKPYMAYEKYSDVVEGDAELNQTLRMKLMAQLDGKEAYLDVKNRTEEDYQLHNLRFWVDNAYQSMPLDQSPEEAAAMVQETLQAMGLEQWVLDSCQSIYMEGNPNSANEVYARDRYYYHLTYKPAYEGVPVIPQSQLEGSEGMEAYTSRYYYENLTVEVSGGRIIYLQWDAPLQVLAVENPSVQTLSFEEAMQRFEEQMAVQATAGSLYQAEEGYEPQAIELRIEIIELGLARVRIQNNQAEYYLLPVWNFKGQLGVDTGQGMFYDSDLSPYYTPHTFLTINAVDGSVVDVSQGY